MLQFKFALPKRGLDLPLYRLSEKKDRTKSTFVDSNRTDTVRPFSYLGRMTLDEFITSNYFNEIIVVNCYEAFMSNNRVVLLSDRFGNEKQEYLEHFFLNNKLGTIIDVEEDYFDDFCFDCKKVDIKIKLNENITFEDIGNAYISELEKINVPDGNIKCKKLILEKKINNEGN